MRGEYGLELQRYFEADEASRIAATLMRAESDKVRLAVEVLRFPEALVGAGGAGVEWRRYLSEDREGFSVHTPRARPTRSWRSQARTRWLTPPVRCSAHPPNEDDPPKLELVLRDWFCDQPGSRPADTHRRRYRRR